MKQLDKLLFEQGEKCFFCQKHLVKSDASVEHLLAQANGGTNVDENVVACCKTLNALLGSKPLKEKISIVLRQKGVFTCPGDRSAPAEQTEQATSKVAAASKTKLKNTQPKASSPAPNVVSISNKAKPVASNEGVGNTQCPTCRRSVTKVANQSGYRCAYCKTAFQY